MNLRDLIQFGKHDSVLSSTGAKLPERVYNTKAKDKKKIS